MTYSDLLTQFKNQKMFSNNSLAKNLGISSVYLGEILNGKKRPPQRDIQLKIIDVLELNDNEKCLLFDSAARERNEIPADIDCLIRGNPNAVYQIREMEIGKKMIIDEMVSPIQKNVKAKSHTAQYRMHKYFARRPFNVFQNLIDHYTKENDIILDCFLGGGVTVFESASMERRVVGVDINPLSTFISRQQMFNGDLDFAEKFLESFIEKLKSRFESFYEIEIDGSKGIAKWTELAYSVVCPSCKGIIILSESNKVKNGIYRCSNENCVNNETGVKRISCNPLASEVLRVKYTNPLGDIYIADEDDFRFTKTIAELEKLAEDVRFKPDFVIPDDWDRQYEDKLYDKGFRRYSDIYTRKNYLLNCLIYDEIKKLENEIPREIYELVYFLFSSSLRYTNNMSRVTANWEGGNPTSMDKHAYWFPNQYVESNIFDVLNKRLGAILKGIKFSKDNLHYDTHEVSTPAELLTEHGSYMVLNQSSTELPFSDETFNVVITDPPYGSNVQYAELSVVWNAWFQDFANLDNYIYNTEEAVMNRKVANLENPKTEIDYEQLLYGVFKEANRVLKNEHYLVFTFNNKNIKVWIAMLNAVAKAGFYLPEKGIIFQDFIESYKNTSHLQYSGNIHGDFIYSFIKGKKLTQTTGFRDNQDIMNVIQEAVLLEISKLFDEQDSYSTTDLYQNIFTELVITILDYIDQFGPIQDISVIKGVSDEAIDNILKRELQFVDNVWQRKVSKDGLL